MRVYPEAHQQGTLAVENLELHLGMRSTPLIRDVDFGVQIAEDGRVWVCLNGIAFLRFSPHPDGKMYREKAPVEATPNRKDKAE